MDPAIRVAAGKPLQREGTESLVVVVAQCSALGELHEALLPAYVSACFSEWERLGLPAQC